ncbi:flagellar basal-body rod protein FlgG [Paraliobacillus quinghaiensis]|uniref:Flagellar hook protein FlgE n=1 Tax=Paraliobacillus quinghaiensis TaxID=470815 RepID=A0A917THW5_9BACI|nr:flagellar basal body rod protein FlgG [Paraliobacillus quinghaiensis]GGM21433.1 flagellar basal-body rod protein FlgG [Paraliobacillus quinghaiensis]
MLRSMYAGISGMKNFQTKLDVIGNNIANVNTSGFKKGRVTFQDMMSQMVSGAEGPVPGNRGGVNAAQVGLGSQVGSIDNIQTQGNRQTTNRTLDLSLEGDGLFVVGRNLIDGATLGIDLQQSDVSFTRSGNFYLDNDGNIVNSDGLYLLGEGSEDAAGTGDFILNGELNKIAIPADAASFSIADNGTVNYVDPQGNTQIAGQIRLASFSNPGGLERTGSNSFRLTDNAGAFNDGDDLLNNINDLVTPGEQGSASIVSGSLEMSNVDLAEEFTEMITAQRAFQSNTKIITTSDEILQELVNLKR